MPNFSRFLLPVFLLLPAFFSPVPAIFGQSELYFSSPDSELSQNHAPNGRRTYGQSTGQNYGQTPATNSQVDRNQDVINSLRRNVRTAPPEITPSYTDALPLSSAENFHIETVSPQERFAVVNSLRNVGTTSEDRPQARMNTYRTASYSEDSIDSEGDESWSADSLSPSSASAGFSAEGLPSINLAGSSGEIAQGDKPLPRTGVSAEIRQELDEKYAALPALSPPGDFEEGEKSDSGTRKTTMPFDLKSTMPVVGSLVLVLGAFFLFAVLMKKVNPNSGVNLPKDAFEVVGKTQLTQKQQLHLIRIGFRLVLVSVSPDGVQPICEITDQDEVARVLGMIRRKDSNGSSAAFNKILDQYAAEPTQGGYFGAEGGNRKRSSTLNRNGMREEEELEEESLASILAGGAEKLISGGKRLQNARTQAARSYANG